MKKLFLGICYLLFSHWLQAQHISGKVTDAVSGAAVASATVELSNIATTTTNGSGVFEFTKIRQGQYRLRISSIGYLAVETTVSPNNAVQEFKLERLNLFMQPVEVRSIQAGEKAPFTKTNLTKKEIEKQNLGQDIPFILNQTPSVVVSSDAGNGIGYTGIRIRGTDATRINVTLNGIPYNDAESQGTFFVNLPDFSSSLNSIQVQRGVGTSSNGASAFGATINLSTNEVNTTPYAEINNSVGSFNTWKHTVKAGSGLINDHFTIDARLSKISSDGFVDRAASDLRSFHLSGAYVAAKTSVRFNIFSGKEKTYQSWYGVSADDLKAGRRTVNYAGMEKPGDPYDNQTDNYQQDHYQLFINHQFNPKLTVNTAFFWTKGKGYYEEYKAAQTMADYGVPYFAHNNDTIRETDLVRQLWLDNDFFGQVFSVQYKGAKDQLTVGGGWNRYNGNHFGEVIWAQVGIPVKHRYYNPTAYKTDVNGYAKYQYKLSPQLEVFGDLQYRRVLYQINGFRVTPDRIVRNIYDFVNPKLGITYTNRDYLLYASYSLGNKEPNRNDFEANAAGLQPERLHDFEAGIEKKNGRYSWGATVYYMLYKNQLVLTGNINDVGSYIRMNVPDSYRAGLELQGKARVTQWLQAGGNLTFSKNRIKDFTKNTNTDIAFSPEVVGGAVITFLPLKDLDVSLLGKYVGRQYLNNTSNAAHSLKEYYVQDARVSYTLRKLLFKEITLAAQVNNVFDKKYEPNGYTYSYDAGGALVTENAYFPMAGTNFMLALQVKL